MLANLGRLTLALLFISAGSLTVFAQQATVQGVVTDSSGAAVPAAKISVRNVSTGVASNVETNQRRLLFHPLSRTRSI